MADNLLFYYLNVPTAAVSGSWDAQIQHCAEMGFTTLVLDGLDNSEAGSYDLLNAAKQRGLGIILDTHNYATDLLADRWLEKDCSGYLVHPPRQLDRSWLRSLRDLRERCAPFILVWAPGLPREAVLALDGLCDAVVSSLAWWDGKASWLVEEYEAFRRIGRVIGLPTSPYSNNLPDQPRTRVLRAWTAAATAHGILLPMGYERGEALSTEPTRGSPPERKTTTPDLSQELAKVTRYIKRNAEFSGELRMFRVGPNGPTALLRCDTPDARQAHRAIAVLLNTDHSSRDPANAFSPVPPQAGASFVSQDIDDKTPLGPEEIRFGWLERAPLIISRVPTVPVGAYAASVPRIVIEAVSPVLDGARFPIKRIVGEKITVSADIYIDGHGREIEASLLWRAEDESQWRRVEMVRSHNDRWQAEFAPQRIGLHAFTIEAWEAPYESFSTELTAKARAGVDITLEIEDGLSLVRRALPNPSEHGLLDDPDAFKKLSRTEQVAALLDPALRTAIRQAHFRTFETRYPLEQTVRVDRPQAAFSSWYELFPRSATDNPERHGTFADVRRRLPDVRAMGFDVLYMPPIHPIGAKNRKGRNNTLTAQAGEPGSPYAIGSSEGGHTTIHPELGSLEEFQALVLDATRHGLEVALDFAIQCSPDHPWLREHPEWFAWRSDGSVRYAENPPKKYQDIVNVEFYQGNPIPALWEALRDIVLFWATQGVRIFRVDNPHTKPFPFWEWMITEVQRTHPDVIFLSEAFTRPKPMYRLAKLGFTQSYTYFIWRNTKQELIDYLTELTTSEVKEFFRPNFFANTPDINPIFLQTSGRAGFLIRAALAATLSGSWGVYSGFELCEAAPLPGKEEYLDSEKYEIRARDYASQGNIKREIALLNRIRKSFPALQSHLGVKFYNANDPNILVYGKSHPSSDERILIAVNLDPHTAHETRFEIPLWEWSLPDTASAIVQDLVNEKRFVWSGKIQSIRLDPDVMPFAIWRLSPLRSALA